MKLMKVKTARFSEMVEACGKPQTYTLWRKPEDDPHLKKLVAQNHVMTVHHSDESADFGEVGLHPRKGSSYLVFPKSLKRFLDRRIVGIKWELMQ